jgi:hypothetical protein
MGVAGDMKGAVKRAGDEINDRAEAGFDKVGVCQDKLASVLHIVVL